MTLLAKKEIADWIEANSAWRLEDEKLMLSLKFENFSMAWGFMSRVALLAEQQDHHPNWYNVYSIVQIRLSSHDANGITERDFALVRSIDHYLANELHTDLPATPISST